MPKGSIGFASKGLLRLLTLAALSLATAHSATAGVIYRWVDVSVNQFTGPIDGELVINEADWQIGGGVNAYYFGGMGPMAIPGIESLSFRGTNLQWSVDYDSTNLQFQATFGFEIEYGAVLTGSRLYFSEEFDTLLLRPVAGPLWQIDYFGTDSGGPCQVAGQLCRGGTGTWVLDLTTIPVPEPSSLALFGTALGLGVLSMARNRFRRHAQPKA